jgi:quercetin dioxygenase-like cupin family protein/uncharacterized cupin superfamily protein
MPTKNQNQHAEISLPCSDLVEALEFFTRRMGFRLEMITPAEAPRIAVITGHGVTMRLETCPDKDESGLKEPESPRELIINRFDSNQSWNAGRAGMLYRDLIPGRLGGRFIASHIRIPGGGEVADYVHFHKVRFQMIYCKAGWVRVVYEDQGPPFVLEPGDCVLQPPEIRHRVLESSPGLEVIEISGPATHATYTDHELQLPTARFIPGRLFRDQRFVRHRANQAQWSSQHGGVEFRDLGVAEATDGLAAARVLRSTCTASLTTDSATDADLFCFVLGGEFEIGGLGQENPPLRAGDSALFPAGMRYVLSGGVGSELLEVRLPAMAERPDK